MTKRLTYKEEFVSLNGGHSFHIVCLRPNKQNLKCDCCSLYEAILAKIQRDDGMDITLCTNCAEKILHFNIPGCIKKHVQNKQLTIKTIPLENDVDAEDTEFHIKEPILNFLRKI